MMRARYADRNTFVEIHLLSKAWETFASKFYLLKLMKELNWSVKLDSR